METDEGQELQRRRGTNGRAAQKSKAQTPGKWIGNIAWFQNADGSISWKIRYRVPLYHGARKTKQQPETLRHCDSRKQAEAVLASRQAAIFNGAYRPESIEASIPLAEYARDYFLTAKAGKPVHAEYERYVRLHIAPALGSLPMRAIELRHINAYRAQRLKEGASKKYVKNEIDCLSTMFELAMTEKRADRNPTKGVDHGKTDNRRERMLSVDELERLLTYVSASDGWLRPLFVVLYYTGMRLSDALSLSWDRINFEVNYLAQKQKKTGEWVFPPMHPGLVRELLRWRLESTGSKWVFPQMRNKAKHISRHAVKVPWAAMLEAAGVEDFTRHDMRKLLATSLKALGAKTSAVKTIGGWATDKMVDEVYNLGPDIAALEEAREAIALLPDLNLISAGSKPAVNHEKPEQKNVDETRNL